MDTQKLQNIFITHLLSAVYFFYKIKVAKTENIV